MLISFLIDTWTQPMLIKMWWTRPRLECLGAPSTWNSVSCNCRSPEFFCTFRRILPGRLRKEWLEAVDWSLNVGSHPESTVQRWVVKYCPVCCRCKWYCGTCMSYRAVERLIFFNRVNRAIIFFNRALINTSIRRLEFMLWVAVSEGLHVLLFRTHIQDATTVELTIKQWCTTDKLTDSSYYN